MNGINDFSEAETPVETAWERVENWLMENAPMTLLTLNEGATEKEIWAAEAALGRAFPPNVVESARIHNGQAEGTLIGEAQFLPLLEMASARTRRENHPNFNPYWLPLTTDEAGNHACLTETGTVVWWQHDTNETPTLAPNFAAWLTQFADALEAGTYIWSQDYDALTRSEDAE